AVRRDHGPPAGGHRPGRHADPARHPLPRAVPCDRPQCDPAADCHLRPSALAIPSPGPFLAIAVNAILLAIGIAGVTGLLGPILTPFVSGLKIPIYDQPKLFQMLPAEGPV